ncbi:MAG: thioredoxin-disulfide reductase [Desulfobacterales bacterium]|jgi:thioredoxin reductase (NADPH)
MANREYYDVVIIGGGPAGLSAGIYALRASMRTVLIEKASPGGQMTLTDAVENYPGFKNINGFELSEKFLDHAKSYNLEVLSQEVAALEPGLDWHTIELDNNERLKSHSVILASGGQPRKLNIPGEDELYGKGVSYCAVCDGFFFRNKTVVVVGGGDTAAEEALYLSKITAKVYLVHRRDALRASMILQQRLQADKKIEIIWDSIVTAIKSHEDQVGAVELKNTQTGETRALSTDGVFIFIGFDPNNQLVPAGTKVNSDGYVCTDEKCETNLPGVFAVGDLREKYARQIVLAAADGCTAALAAAYYVEVKRAAENL